MVFAEREYEIEGVTAKLVLQIGEPYLMDESWVCEHRLTGPDPSDVEVSETFGVDKVQALALTFRRISVDLESLSEEIGARITWMGDPRLDLI